jgi:predicted alpha/beta-fold hydrolase
MLSPPMSEPPPFRPPFWGRSPILQTVLAQTRLRTWGKNEMVEREREEVVRLAHGISVQGIYSSARGTDCRGLAILLSGWEGHARSTYMLRTGRLLYRAGFDVYRITYPDHGDTHDLNEAVFHFGMLDKVTEALHRVVGSIRTRPVVVAGFSMGGNLALNVACRGLPGLKCAIAVSPAIDFARAMQTLQSSVFHNLFLKSWKGSLERKQKMFPHRYDFKKLEKAQSVSEVAGDLLRLEGGAPIFEDYVSRYSLTPAKLKQLMVPAHIIAAVDDPIVGKVDYQSFEGIDRLQLHIQARGGHVGFLQSLFGPAWYETRILELLNLALAPRAPVSSQVVEAVPK